MCHLKDFAQRNEKSRSCGMVRVFALHRDYPATENCELLLFFFVRAQLFLSLWRINDGLSNVAATSERRYRRRHRRYRRRRHQIECQEFNS